MATEKIPQETSSEKLARFGRNINALGALAIAGMAILMPGPNPLLAGWAELNGLQAGGFELFRRHRSNKRGHTR